MTMPKQPQQRDFFARKATAHGVNLDIMVDTTGCFLMQKFNAREVQFG
jgi:hypothetical protein